MAKRDDDVFDEDKWSQDHDFWFFMACGQTGGESRSPKKLAAANQNLIKANAARKAKAEARRQRQANQGQVALG